MTNLMLSHIYPFYSLNMTHFPERDPPEKTLPIVCMQNHNRKSWDILVALEMQGGSRGKHMSEQSDVTSDLCQQKP